MSLAHHGPTKSNGAAKPPRPPATAAKPDPERYHGIPVLRLRVGDPIPTPPFPVFYAVEVYPDLARHLLTLNHPDNRNARDGRADTYGRDMLNDRWPLTPEAIVWDVDGVLNDGQNRLIGVTVAGRPVWLLMTFGWPKDIITAINRGASRTNVDTLKIAHAANSTIVSGAMTLVERYAFVRNSNPTRQFSGLPAPSSQAVLAEFFANADEWHAASTKGSRVYEALDKGLSPSTWAGAHRLIAIAHDIDTADEFLDEVRLGTGDPRSATRVLGDFYRRRGLSDTASGDSREPLENIIRAFNAWRAGKAVSLVKRSGFELSPVR